MTGTVKFFIIFLLVWFSMVLSGYHRSAFRKRCKEIGIKSPIGFFGSDREFKLIFMGPPMKDKICEKLRIKMRNELIASFILVIIWFISAGILDPDFSILSHILPFSH